MVYKEIKLGVYIQDTAGQLWTADEWDGSATANGVAVVADECSFVIALGKTGYTKWGGRGTEVSGITTTTSENSARLDYDGEAQTTTIINALSGTNDGYADGAPVAESCQAYIFPNGNKGYLGSAGEWAIALANKSEINSALLACGGEYLTYNSTTKVAYWWTSTQYDSTRSWFIDWANETLGYDTKSTSDIREIPSGWAFTSI